MNYRRPTKLQEGNVFIRVCLFTGQSHVTITHDALDFTVQGCPMAPSQPAPLDIGLQNSPGPTPLWTWGLGPPLAPDQPASDIWWPS